MRVTDQQDTDHRANPFGQEVIDAVALHMNRDHPQDSLLIVRALGRLPDATEASVVWLDGDAIEFEAVTGGGARRVRVPWSEPITQRPRIRAEVTRMYHDACAALGVEPRTAGQH